MSVSTTPKLESIVIKGSKFFYETSGKQFFVKGIIHFPPAGKSDDLLGDDSLCGIDAKEMQKLGINVVHMVVVDINLNHSKCFREYQAAGIYVLIRIRALYFDDFSWSAANYRALCAVVDNLVSFPNVLGFVLADRLSTGASVDGPRPEFANVKATIRDLKLYMRENNYRQIPLGVAGGWPGSTDASYLLCGNSTALRMDFWIQFPSSRCSLSMSNNANYIDSSSKLETNGVPILLEDFTCDKGIGGNRNFTDLRAVLGPELSKVLSGGIVYKWRNDDENMGMFTVILDTTDNVTYTILGTGNDNAERFQSVLLGALPSSTLMSNYNPSQSTAPACQTMDMNWPIHTNLPPSPRIEVCECMVKSLSCVVGPSLSDKSVSTWAEKLCLSNPNSCAGFRRDGTIGLYGAFSFCEKRDGLSWQLSYLQKQSTNSSACGVEGLTEFVRSREPNVDARCSTLLASAGPLGETTIKFEVAAITSGPGVVTTTPTSTQTNAKATSDSPAKTILSAQKRNLSSGAIAGVAVGMVALTAILVGLYLFWRRQRARRMAESGGLEVGLPPAGYEHVKNVELEGEGEADARHSELPVPKQRLELGDMIQKSEINRENEKAEVEKVGSPAEETNNQVVMTPETEIEARDAEESGGLMGLSPEEQLAFSNATSHEVTEEPFSPSWSGGSWFDPNDPRQGLTGSPPLVEKSKKV